MPTKAEAKPADAPRPARTIAISSDLLKMLIEKPALSLLDDSVLTLAEFATWAGISEDTLIRLRAKGEGPTITQLTDRKQGVRVRHGREWLDARASTK